MDSRARNRVRGAIDIVGAAAFSVAVALITGEFLIRTFSLIDAISFHPRSLYTTSEDPRRPYRLRPGESDLLVMGRRVSIDARGMRGKAVPREEWRREGRVIALGDSVVFGWGLEEDETFSVGLERELRARGRPSHVVNAGTPGYNTRGELATLEALAPALEPDLVVLGVSLNDFGPMPRLSARGYLTTREAAADLRWLDRSSDLYALWRWLRGRAQTGAVFGPQRRDEDQKQLVEFLEKRAISMREAFYEEPEGDGLERTLGSLQQLRDYAAERGIELAVVLFPERDQVESGSSAPAPQGHWMDWCDRLGLRCLDLRPAFLESGAGGAAFGDLLHPNARGIAVAVRATADWLDAGEGP